HSRVEALSFSPDGQVLLTGGDDTLIRAWDVGSGTELRSFAGHIGRIIGLAFAPNGQSFVSQGDNTVRVWSLSSGQLLHTFTNPGGGVFRGRFTPDGNRLVTAEISFTNMPDGSVGVLPDNIRVRDLATEQTIRRFGGTNFIQNFEFVGDGHLVTDGPNQAVQVWDIETGQLIRSLQGATPAEIVIAKFLTATDSTEVIVGCLIG